MRTLRHIKRDLVLVDKFIKATKEKLKETPKNLGYIFKLKSYLESKKELNHEYKTTENKTLKRA